MAEHTPTPWTHVEMESGGFKIVPADDPNFKICRIENSITYLMAFDDAAESDAAFIVKAANNHEAMLTELRRLHELYGHQQTADIIGAVGESSNG